MYSSQKGISLFLTIIVLSVVLGIVLGLSTILVGQMKTLQTMGDSVIAFYAADAGVEEVLRDVVVDTMNLKEDYNGNFSNMLVMLQRFLVVLKLLIQKILAL